MCVQIDDQIERDFFPKHTYLITSFTLADENHVEIRNQKSFIQYVYI